MKGIPQIEEWANFQVERIKPSSFELQISTKWQTPQAAFLFVQVMKTVVTINDSDKKNLSAQKISFLPYPSSIMMYIIKIKWNS